MTYLKSVFFAKSASGVNSVRLLTTPTSTAVDGSSAQILPVIKWNEKSKITKQKKKLEITVKIK